MIYTGYFAKIKEYEKAGLTPIAICGKSPSFFKGQQLKCFAPSWDIFSSWKSGLISNEEYIERFKNEILGTLTIKAKISLKVWFGVNKNVVLLCYEKSDDFCHRHIVAEWIREELKLDCKEFDLK